jgi:DNA-binding winged helix-turn-helix (wHTH) protein/tetratricopeptide (TPR) repeat protein/TolB-like protein
MPLTTEQIYTFDVFRYDVSTGELWRNGYPLKMPEQASRVLGLLLEHAGAIVTREELRAFLWPDGEHVDYDHSISNSISRLRAILRDDLRSPVYIATISKRGYRFIAPVESVFPDVPERAAEPTGHASETDLAEVSAANPSRDEMPVEPTALPPQVSAVPRSFLRRYALAASAVLLIVVIAMGAWGFKAWRQQQSTPRDIYLGVAPFVVLQGERTLADSFRLDLADALSLLPGVRVSAAHSFPEGRLDEAAIRKLGQDAHLDIILLTKFSVQQQNCTLEFELVRARDAVHLGSFRYSGRVDDLSSIRDRVQREVFARLDLVRFATHPVSPPSTDPRAYELYLRARFDLLQQTNESLTRAIDEFTTVTSIDPHFAKAYSGMANAYVTLADHDGLPVQEGYQHAMALASKAIEMDPESAEGHALLGYASLNTAFNLDFAEQEMRRAIELEPNSARYHLWLAVLFGEEARFDEGYRQIDLARAADPFWPVICVPEAFIAASARDNDRMVEAGSKLLKLEPDWSVSHDEMGWIYWYSGHPKMAAEQWLAMARLDHEQHRIDLEEQGLKALAHGGPSAYIHLRLKVMREAASWKHSYHDFFEPEWYSCADDRESAIRLLQQIVEKKEVGSLVIAGNPMYDSLRSDQRFKTLMVQIYGKNGAATVQKRLDARLNDGKALNAACPINTKHAAIHPTQLLRVGDR